MSEEEKKAIKALKIFNKIVEMVKFNYMGLDEEEKEFVNNNDYVYNTKKSIITVLNLIENQQKELNNIKEIEKSHQEENGKLRVKLTKQEKMIEYMVNWINDHEDPFEGCHENEKCGDDYISCEQCIKQYFKNKAEEEN